MLTKLSENQWQEFETQGFIRLGKIDEQDLAGLGEGIESIMMGKAAVDYNRLLMQLDSETGAYEDAGEQSKGFKGSTLNYRKIQELEYVPTFLNFLQRPLFRHICERVYSRDADVAIFRAMFMNKPANRGTFLPWHQDRWTTLDRDPLITVWTAIDPATTANGCVQVVPKSHAYGLINPTHPSGFLNKAQSAAICTEDRIVHLELEPGEMVLLHNYLLHASDVNKTSVSRRALSVCYMDAATIENGRPCSRPVAFGQNALRVEELEPAMVG